MCHELPSCLPSGEHAAGHPPVCAPQAAEITSARAFAQSKLDTVADMEVQMAARDQQLTDFRERVARGEGMLQSGRESMERIVAELQVNCPPALTLRAQCVHVTQAAPPWLVA